MPHACCSPFGIPPSPQAKHEAAGILARVKRALIDILVPGVIGVAVLVVVDVVRGGIASWYLVLLIFVVVFAIYEGLRYLQRRSR